MFWIFLAEHIFHTATPLADRSDSPWLKNRQLGGWKLLASIGKGGFGEAFLAEKGGIQKALKVFTPAKEDSKSFDMEYSGMRFAQGVTHANFVPIEFVGKAEHCIYYVMPPADTLSGTEYIPATLSNVMIERQLSENELIQMAAGILSALSFLHGKKLIHRDVKPENILRFGKHWKLGDPGLVSPSRPKEIAGTPGFYINLKSRRTDETDDLYALGKVLYFACTGMNPEHYPLVPENYDYDRYSRLRPIYRNACERKYKSSGEFLEELEKQCQKIK